VDGAGEFYGTERLTSALQSTATLHPKQICEALWQALKAYQGTMPQDDDVTLVAVGIRNGTDGHKT
jgi:serine phosphatase RsbU (regulator of sigma subunit)